MDLRQLTHFLAVVDNGSLGDAARQLGLSQPALTKSIQSLERSLGVPLFTRSVQGMTLNEYGRTLEIRARTMSIAATRAQERIRELKGLEHGKVVIAGGILFAESILPMAVARFRTANPGIDLVVTEGTLDAFLPGLAIGEYDFALVVLTEASNRPDLAHEVLFQGQRASVVTRASNPLAARADLAASDVWPGPWLLPMQSDDFRSRLARAFQQGGLPGPRPTIEYSSIGMLKRVLLTGDYLALMSHLLIRDELAGGVLRRLTVRGLRWTFDAGALYRSGFPLSPAARAFLETVREVCREVEEDENASDD